MPVYFIRSDQVQQGRIRLEGDLGHHLRDVLRLKLGESVLLVDEAPLRYHTRVVSARPAPLTLEVEKTSLPPQKPSSICLGVGLLKRTKMEWLLQKAGELGAAQIVPLFTERSVVRNKEQQVRSEHQLARWRKILKEAAQQSCQWQVSRLSPPRPLNDFLSAGNLGFKFILLERFLPPQSARETLQSELASSPKEGALLVGPEGGWSLAEREAAESAGFRPLSLGPAVLRAETAALAALSILQYEISYGNHRAASH